MIHFEGVNTWDVNIYLFYRMNVTTNISLSLVVIIQKKEGGVVVCIFSFLRDIMLFCCSLLYVSNRRI